MASRLGRKVLGWGVDFGPFVMRFRWRLFFGLMLKLNSFQY